MDKKLKKISSKEGRKNLRRRIRKEYQALGNVMRDYLSYPSSLEQSSAHKDGATASTSVGYEATESGIVSDSQALIYVGPAALVTSNTRGMSSTRKSHLSDMGSVGNWVSLQRETIASFLEEGTPEAYTEINALLGQCLSSIRLLIEPQIQQYQQLIQEARQDRVEYAVAIEWSEDLQRRLMKFFRSSVLLFHPDKSHGNEDLSRIQTEFFRQFRQLSETSRETLRAGLELLKEYAPHCEAAIQAILDEIERDRKAFRAELAHMIKALAQMREERKEMRAEMEAKRAQELAEMEVKRAQELAEMEAKRAQELAEMEAKREQERAKMEAKIEALERLMQSQNLSQNQTSKETASSQVQEKPEGSSHFFRP